MGMDSFQFNSRETSQASLQDSLHSLRRVMEVVVLVTEYKRRCLGKEPDGHAPDT